VEINSNQSGPFTPEGISLTPHAAGVYALYNRGHGWVYVGESDDIQFRLSEHYGTPGTCIQQKNANRYWYELVPDTELRTRRRNQFLKDLRPACQQESIWHRAKKRVRQLMG
jgi:predicted GIY-YIG superfamily endonuclease